MRTAHGMHVHTRTWHAHGMHLVHVCTWYAPHRLRATSRPARPRGRMGTPPGGYDISSVPFKRTDTREGATFKNTGDAVRKRALQLGSM